MKRHIPITPRNEKPSIEWPHVEIPGKTAYCFLIILLHLYNSYIYHIVIVNIYFYNLSFFFLLFLFHFLIKLL